MTTRIPAFNSMPHDFDLSLAICRRSRSDIIETSKIFDDTDIQKVYEDTETEYIELMKKFIREFPGYSQLVQNQSDSIFYFIDTPSTQASCIVDNIVLALKRKYHQVNMVSFGRVYISKEENLFRANEILNVF
ncbi:7532_t:CDS:2 [Rhizophagus irregularis]|nr:7532_t:CDS:2 [Rhizophagus irregularis]